jgi:hypothetical protein
VSILVSSCVKSSISLVSILNLGLAGFGILLRRSNWIGETSVHLWIRGDMIVCVRTLVCAASKECGAKLRFMSIIALLRGTNWGGECHGCGDWRTCRKGGEVSSMRWSSFIGCCSAMACGAVFLSISDTWSCQPGVWWLVVVAYVNGGDITRGLHVGGITWVMGLDS